MKSKHNGKIPIKLGSMLLPTEKKENAGKKGFRNFFVTIIMEPMVTELSKKVPKIFECKTCDYSTSRLGQYKRHLATDKHKWYQNGNEKVPAKNECGNCGRCYAHTSALSRHKKHASKK